MTNKQRQRGPSAKPRNATWGKMRREVAKHVTHEMAINYAAIASYLKEKDEENSII